MFHSLSIQSFNNKPILIVYGLIHALVDAACAALVFGLIWQHQLSPQTYLSLIIVYNILAFASQPLCGLLSDKIQNPVFTAFLGIVLTCLSILSVTHLPYVAVVFAGLGNAFFHIGGGTIALTVSPEKAGPSGLFVAPGAIGLTIGTIIGKNSGFPVLLFFVLCIVALAAIIFFKPQGETSSDANYLPHRKWQAFIAMLLLISITIRSLVGFSAGSPWQGHKTVLLFFVVAIFFGKAFGGIISDKVGWLKTATIALLLSVPFLALGFNNSICTIIGILLLQMTMPITLAALYRLFPQKPGFTFGLACLALIIGATPAFSPFKQLFSSWQVVTGAGILSILSTFFGLLCLKKLVERKYKKAYAVKCLFLSGYNTV
jgi:FSR family fosmidomycin resistance protein-like MFS transporter